MATQEIPQPKILPFDVRYALEYREGQMGAEEVEALARNGLMPQASYLCLKTLADRRDYDAYADLLFKMLQGKDIDVSDLAGIMGDDKVDGQKLALVSRVGFDAWQQGFAKLSEELKEENKIPFLIANSALIGANQFANLHTNIGIIVPGWLDQPMIGLFYSGNDLFPLTADFPRDDTICLVDDVIRTGKSRDQVMALWPTDALPSFRMIDDARN